MSEIPFKECIERPREIDSQQVANVQIYIDVHDIDVNLSNTTILSGQDKPIMFSSIR